MTNVKRYISFALVAALAASAGWGASALTLHSKSDSAATLPETAQAAAVPATLNHAMPLANLAATEMARPMASALAAQPVMREEAAPVARRPATRARVVNRQVNDETREVVRAESAEASHASSPAYERKSGMSNKTKTAIVIGGGAATGAIIGGIAGGGKGAAIGAIVGGGGGAVYSVIRSKQNKPVW
jgi:hypothetical protein